MSLSSGAVRRPVTTLMFFIAVVVMGFVAYKRLAIDQLPDITFPSVSVLTKYEGASPAEIEKLVTEPIEKAVSTISNVKEVRSKSSEDSSLVTVDFSWGTDIDEAANEVRDKVGQAKRFLPDDADEPILQKYDFGDQPILYMALTGPQNPVFLRDFADNQLRYQLEAVEGVASVDIWGGLQREIQVEIERSRLEAAGLSVQDVVRVLGVENLSVAGGHLESGRTDYIVRPIGEFTSLKQLENVVLRSNHGKQVYLRDVAKVQDGYEDERTRTRVNRGKGAILAIRKQSGGNTVQIADNVLAAVPGVRKDLPQGMKLDVMFNRADFIKKSIKQVKEAALQGGLIAVLVMFLFLFDFKSTFIIGINIPIGMLATLILLYNKGISLNWMSLGGLALGVGMLVDNSVVVLESVFYHRKRGTDIRDACIKGSNEVGMAITASTLTNICVFLPLIFVKGMMGIVFAQLALTNTFSLLASLLVALTLIPMLYSRFESGRAKTRSRMTELGNWFLPVEERYRKFLGRVLDNKGKVILVSFVILFATVMVLKPPKAASGLLLKAFGGNKWTRVVATAIVKPRIGSELLPSVDEGMMFSYVEMPVGTRIGLTDDALNTMEETVVANVTEARALFARAGLMWQGGGGTHTGFLWIKLSDRSERNRPLTQVMNTLRSKFAQIPDAKIRLIERPSDVSRMLGAGRQERVEIDVVGYDLRQSETASRKIVETIQKVNGISFARLNMDTTRPEMKINIDRDKAGSLGLSASEIVNTVKTSVDGTVASRYRERGNEYDIRVRLNEENRQNLEDLEHIFLTTRSDKRVALKNIATFAPDMGPVEINRRGLERVITVQGGMTGLRDFGSVMDDIEREVSNLELPKGVSTKFAGERQQQKESGRYMLLAGLLALMLVYMVMASLFESLLDPFVIMFSIPFSLIGVLLILFLTHTNFNIPAYMGIMVLAGIVVNNAIVMIDYIGQLRRGGMELKEAVMAGGSRRLRPILITTLTTIVGIIPMSLGFGEGAEMWSPLARVVLAGLSVGTLFTLFFIPALYATIESGLLWLKARKEARA